MRRSTEKVVLDLKVKVWKSRHHDFRKKRGNGSLMDAPERNIVRASDPEFTHFYDKSGKFTVHLIQIIDGKTSLWGELIKGK